MADATAAAEYERSRRRRLQALADRVVAGERIRHRRADAPEGTKWCARCQEFRPLTSFSKSGGRPVAYCKPCQKSYNRQQRLKHTFGLTQDEYDQLLADQEFRCAICRGRPRKNALSVDHDHKTGEIRGLLCSRCNHRLLGAADESPAKLRRAAAYLEGYEARDTFGEARFVPGFGSDGE